MSDGRVKVHALFIRTVAGAKLFVVCVSIICGSATKAAKIKVIRSSRVPHHFSAFAK
ncbi:hypothetical protein M405DRAFT_824082 [Rhizopogon salebrosus TDB-379]|nr:hypothetical protein M405DRAFT_832331 [Rhizopogon salebrosus TDB-379]KAJ8585960.1 hypothetical protein M405DRAFT_824082 [Rhizopogon salebrosus TDB-379]